MNEEVETTDEVAAADADELEEDRAGVVAEEKFEIRATFAGVLDTTRSPSASQLSSRSEN